MASFCWLNRITLKIKGKNSILSFNKWIGIEPHPKAVPGKLEISGFFEPHPKAVPRKLEISGFLKCFFTYSSGVILSSAEWGLNPL